MKLSKYEMETIVNFNVEEDKATVYTRDFAVMKRLDALVREFPEDYALIRETDMDKTYEMPKGLVNFRRPYSLSEEWRGRLRERMVRINAGRAGGRGL